MFHTHDGKLRHISFERLRCRCKTYAKEGPLHVEVHLFVIQVHNLHETFESSDLDRNRGTLSSLAHNLHDVVSFALKPLLVQKSRDKSLIEQTSRSKLSLMNSRELYKA